MKNPHSKTVNIVIYGAFDRHNYGDLLFALILNKFSNEFGFSDPTIASTTDSDLTKYGALRTVAIGKFIKKLQDNTSIETRLIVAGGDVLGTRWSGILGFLYPPPVFFALRATAHLIGHPVFALFASRLSGLNARFPFVPPANILKNSKIYYNSVGGSPISKRSPKEKLHLKDSLSTASYISVRDEATFKALEDLGIQAVLVPDSAIVMSLIHPEFARFPAISRTKDIETIPQKNSYIVFQIAENYAKGAIEQLVSQLQRLHEDTGLKICLLTIGKATGHSDDIPLDEIHQALGTASFRVSSGNVLETMEIIAKSSAYCGTSLHGAITAMAYEVPQIAIFENKVSKLTDFLKTWSKADFFRLSTPNKICSDVQNCINSSSNKEARLAYHKHIESMQNLVVKSMQKIFSQQQS